MKPQGPALRDNANPSGTGHGIDRLSEEIKHAAAIWHIGVPLEIRDPFDKQ
jgi:hypothetical protein